MHESLENENDQMVDNLSSKVKALKSVCTFKQFVFYIKVLILFTFPNFIWGDELASMDFRLNLNSL